MQMDFWVDCWFFKEHLEAVHVLCVYSGAAESFSVEKSTLNLPIHPVPAQVKSLGPPYILAR